MSYTKGIEAGLDKVAKSIDKLTKEMEKHRSNDLVVRNTMMVGEGYQRATTIDGVSVVNCGQVEAIRTNGVSAVNDTISDDELAEMFLLLGAELQRRHPAT